MSAAFRVGRGYAALQGFWPVARGWELLPVGRNGLANRVRIAVLPVVRLNLLKFSILFDQLQRSARSLQ